MKRIFICSPLAGDIKKNIKFAEQKANEIAINGNLPLCPHQIARYLDDNNAEERALGMRLSLELLKLADIVMVYGKSITPGMAGEIKTADVLNKYIVYKEKTGDDDV